MEIRQYHAPDGRSPFQTWFDQLDATAAARVTVALTLGLGNSSNVKSVGSGVLELKINFGPGYRVYFGKDGDEIVILVGSGTKKRQQADIKAANNTWQAYKKEKKE